MFPTAFDKRLITGLVTLAASAAFAGPALAQDPPPPMTFTPPTMPPAPPAPPSGAPAPAADPAPAPQPAPASEPAPAPGPGPAPSVVPTEAVTLPGAVPAPTSNSRRARPVKKRCKRVRVAGRHGAKARYKVVCKKKPAKPKARAHAASAGPRFVLGQTDCLSQPFSGVQSNDPLVTAADADPGVDEQYIASVPVRFRWNGSAWAYESTGSWRTTFATENAYGTQVYDGHAWGGRGNQGWSATPGYYAIAQYVYWYPTKSAPQALEAYAWTSHVANGQAVSYCTVN